MADSTGRIEFSVKTQTKFNIVLGVLALCFQTGYNKDRTIRKLYTCGNLEHSIFYLLDPE